MIGTTNISTLISISLILQEVHSTAEYNNTIHYNISSNNGHRELQMETAQGTDEDNVYIGLDWVWNGKAATNMTVTSDLSLSSIAIMHSFWTYVNS